MWTAEGVHVLSFSVEDYFNETNEGGLCLGGWELAYCSHSTLAALQCQVPSTLQGIAALHESEGLWHGRQG